MRRVASVSSIICSAVIFATFLPLRADGPADNVVTNIRRVPKLGVDVPQDRREKLEAAISKLRSALDELKDRKDAATRELLPDVEIYWKAAHDALKYQEFFTAKEIDAAFMVLDVGQQRAEQLKAGQPAWTSATGLVVRGYVSKIDGSVQPYGLVIPSTYSEKGPQGFRLDLWFHGRGETLSELNFIKQATSNAGQFTPPNTIVLHPYGRYSNAFKFAGEVDVLEALDSVKHRYRIDEDRIAARGFSMGGAATWQFAVHYSDRWFAANPGAGFAETSEFLKIFQNQTLDPTWFERKLWHWYDCPDVSRNLKQCPTVAYSGELDVQKQAADIMQKALAAEQIDLVHLIGPQTKHAYHPQAKDEVERRLAALARGGRDRVPKDVSLTTYTLKYNRMHWLTIDGMREHWERARAEARWERRDSLVEVKTENVTSLTLSFEPGDCPFDLTAATTISIDGDKIAAPRPQSDRSWRVALHQTVGHWKLGSPPTEGLRKKHYLQGPIDDAFMDSFIFVPPSQAGAKTSATTWADAEMKRAIEVWRRHFRGEARVKKDTEINDDDIAKSNLVLWGTPTTNALLGKVAAQLPIQWTEKEIVVGNERFAGSHHALIAIHPNPLNPERYVVINSGFTFREFAFLNNARQVPMLPDWAVVDLTTPPDGIWPGKIVAADFFDEQWKLRKAVSKK